RFRRRLSDGGGLGSLGDALTAVVHAHRLDVPTRLFFCGLERELHEPIGSSLGRRDEWVVGIGCGEPGKAHVEAPVTLRVGHARQLREAEVATDAERAVDGTEEL